MAPDHPYKKLPLPSNAPFELRLSPGKGYGVFAIRDIDKGELIINETALIKFDLPKQDVDHNHIVRALIRLRRRDKQQFNCIAPTDSAHYTGTREMNIFQYNSWEYRGGCGIFPLASRINHSCLPSSRMGPGDEGSHSVIILSRRQIPAGQEITIDYYDEKFIYKTAAQRRLVTESEWQFVCDCQACQIGTPFQVASDARRSLIAGLEYLLNGFDGKVPNMPDNLRIAPHLAALNGVIPLLVEFCYHVILVCLLDTENELSPTQARKHERFHAVKGFKLLTGARQSPLCGFSSMTIQNILMKRTWRDKAAAIIESGLNFDAHTLPKVHYIDNTGHRVIVYGENRLFQHDTTGNNLVLFWGAERLVVIRGKPTGQTIIAKELDHLLVLEG
ncbi:hypothetical protein F5Y18DRAFT_426178 [Xylariaceae sp. FL1019]|nr:hypothetical protein F5Y18DRAFT_426178 [Xylariaceae sp. FL1019]